MTFHLEQHRFDGASVENIFYLFWVELWNPNGSDQTQKFLHAQPGGNGLESFFEDDVSFLGFGFSPLWKATGCESGRGRCSQGRGPPGTSGWLPPRRRVCVCGSKSCWSRRSPTWAILRLPGTSSGSDLEIVWVLRVMLRCQCSNSLLAQIRIARLVSCDNNLLAHHYLFFKTSITTISIEKCTLPVSREETEVQSVDFIKNWKTKKGYKYNLVEFLQCIV